MVFAGNGTSVFFSFKLEMEYHQILLFCWWYYCSHQCTISWGPTKHSIEGDSWWVFSRLMLHPFITTFFIGICVLGKSYKLHLPELQKFYILIRIASSYKLVIYTLVMNFSDLMDWINFLSGKVVQLWNQNDAFPFIY